jgi:tyrosyl-tRNA synthetase
MVPALLHAPPKAVEARALTEDFMQAGPKNQRHFIQVLRERGFLNQISDEEGLLALAAKGPVAAYVGYDCTAPSLHVGNLISIMMLRVFQQTGNKPIVLVGGGTTKVGDPSGKDETRKLLTQKDIDANKDGIRSAFSKFLTFGEGETDALLVDNDDWLNSLRYIEFLRDYGRHFTINRMLTFDSVKLRLEREQPLTFLEFNYMLLQAYDFLELARRYNCVLQMGGSDQWGNIVNGIELGRRVESRELFGLTTALLTTSSGAKMGKSVKGAVWLNSDMLSPYDYWQFWRNTEDGDVGRFLRLFTDLPLDECARLEALAGSEINEAKKVLATEATALLHGREAAEVAAETARMAFEEGAAAEGLPTVEIPAGDLDKGIGLLTVATLAGLVASTSEARRQIKGGALRVNDAAATDERAMITAKDLNADGVIKLSLGKKRHVLLRPAPWSEPLPS